MTTYCKIKDSYYVSHREVAPGQGVHDDEVAIHPPNGGGPFFVLAPGPEWVNTDVPPAAPAAPPKEPIKISRLELRRLLKAKEAQWFDDVKANSQPLTTEERDEVFDLNTTNMDLQYKAALRDALLQWELLDQGVVEMDHADTASFLTVLGVNGMFGADMATRIPQILAMQPPGA